MLRHGLELERKEREMGLLEDVNGEDGDEDDKIGKERVERRSWESSHHNRRHVRHATRCHHGLDPADLVTRHRDASPVLNHHPGEPCRQLTTVFDIECPATQLPNQGNLDS